MCGVAQVSLFQEAQYAALITCPAAAPGSAPPAATMPSPQPRSASRSAGGCCLQWEDAVSAVLIWQQPAGRCHLKIAWLQPGNTGS